VDWNNDGLIDLVSGEYFGRIHLYLNVGTPSLPVLTKAGFVQVGSSSIDVGYYSVPKAADFNGDGMFDLLVGNREGTVALFINDGTPQSPHFSSMQFVQDGGADLDVGTHSAAAFADMDGDGPADLVVGNNKGRLYFYHNYGTSAAPSFSGGETLKTSGVELRIFWCARPDAVDWDNDGDMDIVAGEYLSIPILLRNDPAGVLIPDLDVVFHGPVMFNTSATISFTVTVGNPHAQPVTFDFFAGIQNRDSGFIGPILNFQSFTMNPGGSVSHTFSHYVSPSVPSGSYYYSLYTGTLADWEFGRREYFYFIKY